MHDDLRALTVRWPWSSAIVYGPKRIENRSWPVPPEHFGKDIALHAGAGADRIRAEDIRMSRALVDGVRTWPRHTGEIVAVVTVTGCHHDTGCCRPWGFAGTWHWELNDVRTVPHPVPVPGRLSLWRVPDDVREAVQKQI